VRADHRFRLSPWQLVVLVFALGLCVTPFSYAERLDATLGRQAWWPGLGATLVGVAGVWPALALARAFPGHPLDRTARRVLGPALGPAYCATLAALFLTGAAATLQIFVALLGTRALPYLPLAYPAVVVGGVGLLAAASGPEAVARTAEALAPLVVLGLGFIFLAPLANAELGNLRPLGPVPWARLATPGVLAALGTVRGYLPLLVLAPFCRPRPRAMGVAAAQAAAGLAVTASLALPVAVFGAPFAGTLLYPFLSAVGTVGWSWLPTQRLVELTLLVWQGIACVVFATYLWPDLPWTALVLCLGGAAIAATAVPLPPGFLHHAVDAWNLAVLGLGILVPAGLWAVARARGLAR
jgi:hypothetical protein